MSNKRKRQKRQRSRIIEIAYKQRKERVKKLRNRYKVVNNKMYS